MSLRQKYLKILSEIMPAGAVGVSLLLGSAAPGDAAQHPARFATGGCGPSPMFPNGWPPFARRFPTFAGDVVRVGRRRAAARLG